MAEAKKSGIVAKAQKRLSRTKTKVLQTLGKADRSTDETFDDLVQKTEKQHDVAHHLQKEIKTYVHCMRALSQASRALATALSQTYEEEWTEEAGFKKGLESLDLLWEDYLQSIGSQVLESVNTYIASFPALKTRIAKRGRKMMDYDNSRHNLEVMQQAKKKDDVKINKAQEDLNESKRIYEELHNELCTELPEFYNSRVTFYADLFQKFFSCERTLHFETSRISESLNQICQNLSKDYVQFVYQPKRPVSKSLSDNSDEPPHVTNGDASPHQASSASASPATTPTTPSAVDRSQDGATAATAEDADHLYSNQDVVMAASKVNGDVDKVKEILKQSQHSQEPLTSAGSKVIGLISDISDCLAIATPRSAFSRGKGRLGYTCVGPGYVPPPSIQSQPLPPLPQKTTTSPRIRHQLLAETPRQTEGSGTGEEGGIFVHKSYEEEIDRALYEDAVIAAIEALPFSPPPAYSSSFSVSGEELLLVGDGSVCEKNLQKAAKPGPDQSSSTVIVDATGAEVALPVTPPKKKLSTSLSSETFVQDQAAFADREDSVNTPDNPGNLELLVSLQPPDDPLNGPAQPLPLDSDGLQVEGAVIVSTAGDTAIITSFSDASEAESAPSVVGEMYETLSFTSQEDIQKQSSSEITKLASLASVTGLDVDHSLEGSRGKPLVSASSKPKSQETVEVCADPDNEDSVITDTSVPRSPLQAEEEHFYEPFQPVDKKDHSLNEQNQFKITPTTSSAPSGESDISDYESAMTGGEEKRTPDASTEILNQQSEPVPVQPGIFLVEPCFIEGVDVPVKKSKESLVRKGSRLFRFKAGSRKSKAGGEKEQDKTADVAFTSECKSEMIGKGETESELFSELTKDTTEKFSSSKIPVSNKAESKKRKGRSPEKTSQVPVKASKRSSSGSSRSSQASHSSWQSRSSSQKSRSPSQRSRSSSRKGRSSSRKSRSSSRKRWGKTQTVYTQTLISKGEDSWEPLKKLKTLDTSKRSKIGRPKSRSRSKRGQGKGTAFDNSSCTYSEACVQTDDSPRGQQGRSADHSHTASSACSPHSQEASLRVDINRNFGGESQEPIFLNLPFSCVPTQTEVDNAGGDQQENRLTLHFSTNVGEVPLSLMDLQPARTESDSSVGDQPVFLTSPFREVQEGGRSDPTLAKSVQEVYLTLPFSQYDQQNLQVQKSAPVSVVVDGNKQSLDCLNTADICQMSPVSLGSSYSKRDTKKTDAKCLSPEKSEGDDLLEVEKHQSGDGQFLHKQPADMETEDQKAQVQEVSYNSTAADRAQLTYIPETAVNQAGKEASCLPPAAHASPLSARVSAGLNQSSPKQLSCHMEKARQAWRTVWRKDCSTTHTFMDRESQSYSSVICVGSEDTNNLQEHLDTDRTSQVDSDASSQPDADADRGAISGSREGHYIKMAFKPAAADTFAKGDSAALVQHPGYVDMRDLRSLLGSCNSPSSSAESDCGAGEVQGSQDSLEVICNSVEEIRSGCSAEDTAQAVVSKESNETEEDPGASRDQQNSCHVPLHEVQSEVVHDFTQSVHSSVGGGFPEATANILARIHDSGFETEGGDLIPSNPSKGKTVIPTGVKHDTDYARTQTVSDTAGTQSVNNTAVDQNGRDFSQESEHTSVKEQSIFCIPHILICQTSSHQDGDKVFKPEVASDTLSLSGQDHASNEAAAISPSIVSASSSSDPAMAEMNPASGESSPVDVVTSDSAIDSIQGDVITGSDSSQGPGLADRNGQSLNAAIVGFNGGELLPCDSAISSQGEETLSSSTDIAYQHMTLGQPTEDDAAVDLPSVQYLTTRRGALRAESDGFLTLFNHQGQNDSKKDVHTNCNAITSDSAVSLGQIVFPSISDFVAQTVAEACDVLASSPSNSSAVSGSNAADGTSEPSHIAAIEKETGSGESDQEGQTEVPPFMQGGQMRNPLAGLPESLWKVYRGPHAYPDIADRPAPDEGQTSDASDTPLQCSPNIEACYASWVPDEGQTSDASDTPLTSSPVSFMKRGTRSPEAGDILNTGLLNFTDLMEGAHVTQLPNEGQTSDTDDTPLYRSRESSDEEIDKLQGALAKEKGEMFGFPDDIIPDEGQTSDTDDTQQYRSQGLSDEEKDGSLRERGERVCKQPQDFLSFVSHCIIPDEGQTSDTSDTPLHGSRVSSDDEPDGLPGPQSPKSPSVATPAQAHGGQELNDCNAQEIQKVAFITSGSENSFEGQKSEGSEIVGIGAPLGEGPGLEVNRLGSFGGKLASSWGRLQATDSHMDEETKKMPLIKDRFVQDVAVNSSQSEDPSGAAANNYYEEPHGNEEEEEEEDGDDDDNAYQSPPSNKPVCEAPRDTLYQVEATHAYNGEDVDELSFDPGDIIYVVKFENEDEQDEGWQMGVKQKDGMKGVFPENFTRKL